MDPRRDDDDSTSRVRVDLPFLSFRLGADAFSASIAEDDAYLQARRRVRARLGFYRHLATYAAVIGAVLFIDLITGGGISEPVRWLVGVWGAIIGWQFLNTFIFPSIWSRETEARMIEDELRKRRDQA